MGKRFETPRFDMSGFDTTGSGRTGSGKTGKWSTGSDSHADVNVGEGYYAIHPELLIEKGDEYLHPSGRFIPFPLEAVGRPVAPGILARRPVGRRPSE